MIAREYARDEGFEDARREGIRESNELREYIRFSESLN